MSEERLQKIKFTTMVGAGIAMGGIVAVQLIIRMLVRGSDTGVEFGEVQMTAMIKSMALFGIIGAVCGFISGALAPVEEKKQPTRVRKETDDEDEDNEAAQETLAKLGISRDQDKPRS